MSAAGNPNPGVLKEREAKRKKEHELLAEITKLNDEISNLMSSREQMHNRARELVKNRDALQGQLDKLNEAPKAA
jgi:uncharacterized coiled-coil DUF342 family protein